MTQYTSKVNRVRKYNKYISKNILDYLRKSHEAGYDFYIQKKEGGLQSFRIDPDKVDESLLSKYLVNTEKKGNKILVHKKGEPLKIVSFSGNDNVRGRTRTGIRTTIAR